jgi:hypothetical protein
MAVAKQQARTRTKQIDYQILEEILVSIKVAVDDQKHNFIQYVNAAQPQGLTQPEIRKLATEIRSFYHRLVEYSVLSIKYVTIFSI